MNKKINIIFSVILLVSFLGFLDSFYLSLQHYRGIAPICLAIEGCESVLTSAYATIGTIPISLFGVIFYLFILFISVWYLDIKNKRLIMPLFFISLSGFLVSLGLVYIQIFVLNEICFYCMISALSSSLIFFLSCFLWYRFKMA